MVVAIAKNAKGLPSAKVVWIAHTNHYAFRPQEADVIREISTFIAGLLLPKPTNGQNGAAQNAIGRGTWPPRYRRFKQSGEEGFLRVGIIPITLDGRRRSTVVAHDFNGCLPIDVQGKLGVHTASKFKAGSSDRSLCAP